MKAGFLIKENENALIVNALFVQNVRGKSKNHAKTVHKGKKVAFVRVLERNQFNWFFSNNSSTESQPSRKLFRAVVQLDAQKVLTMNLR